MWPSSCDDSGRLVLGLPDGKCVTGGDSSNGGPALSPWVAHLRVH